MNHTIVLKSNRDFRRAYRKGKSCATMTLVLYCRKNGAQQNRLGITTGTKVGKAVVRNRIRRRVRAIYRLHETELRAGYDLVIVARVRAADATYAQLEKDFLRLAKRMDLLTGETKA
ncbi:MAG: ribonuclease P protein component [Oscillospiraceae bacterium]|nr:ribonuclease P protein component [Oscillospiraceae bacterium]